MLKFSKQDANIFNRFLAIMQCFVSKIAHWRWITIDQYLILIQVFTHFTENHFNNYRDQPIMLIFYLLCYAPCSAQIFSPIMLNIICSCKRFVLKNLAVLLEYIHLHHKNLM